tara:strand:+ start:317 stop:793 length:477 start_codon:yes stop_codon:yes gene_type:complete
MRYRALMVLLMVTSIGFLQINNPESEYAASASYWGLQEFEVTVTMYNAIVGQTDSTPDITADGTKINVNKATEHRYVALSRDLLQRWGGPFKYGDFIILKNAGDHGGVYQVRDTMSPKFINRVDILLTKGSKPFKYKEAILCKYFKYDEAIFHKHEEK